MQCVTAVSLWRSLRIIEAARYFNQSVSQSINQSINQSIKTYLQSQRRMWHAKHIASNVLPPGIPTYLFYFYVIFRFESITVVQQYSKFKYTTMKVRR